MNEFEMISPKNACLSLETFSVRKSVSRAVIVLYGFSPYSFHSWILCSTEIKGWYRKNLSFYWIEFTAVPRHNLRKTAKEPEVEQGARSTQLLSEFFR